MISFRPHLGLNLRVRNSSPANFGIRSLSEMRVEMVKEKGNCRHTGSTGEHSYPNLSLAVSGYLKFLQMLCCSEESDSVFLDV